MGIQKNRH